MKKTSLTTVTYYPRPGRAVQCNRKLDQAKPEEIIEQRQQTVNHLALWFRKQLTSLMKILGQIEDPRQQGKIKHKLETVLVYGILLFFFKLPSRRQANKQLSGNIIFENLRTVIPELESMPHADTLARLLARIEAEQIQEYTIQWVKGLIRSKKLDNYLIQGRLIVLIDGTQKLVRDYELDPRCLHRKVGEDGKLYSVYVVESVLLFENGLVLPFATEFLENTGQKEMDKQECELDAFNRIAAKLKKHFPKMKITILADGLYACEKVLYTCLKNNWQYMITLKEGRMPAVTEEALSLMKHNPDQQKAAFWGDRKQQYSWANDIEYGYGQYERHKLALHVVMCEEQWTEKRSRTGQPDKECSARYMWLSSQPITEANVFFRCSKLARGRWAIENNILTEKQRGYVMEHGFSDDWQAMKGFHMLMNLAHCLCQLMQHSEMFVEEIKERSVQGFCRWLLHILDAVVYAKEPIVRCRDSQKQWRLCPVI